MEKNSHKISVVIASEQCLTRSGIIALISKLGIDVTFDEVSTFEVLQTKCHEAYLVLDHRMMTKPKGHFFRNVLCCFDGKVLVIGNDKMSAEFHRFIILPHDDENAIIQKLEDFFSDLLQEEQPAENDVLSLREIDILKEVALGYSNKEIGDRLFISINTVITHRKNITDKLGIKTISGLTVYALMNKLINAEDVTF